MGNREIFASRLRKIRQQTGKTQKEFADMVMSTAATISAYENSTKNPSLDIVMNIAEKCHVSIDWLCGLSEKQTYSETFSTYKDIIEILFEIDEQVGIFLESVDDDVNNVVLYFGDYILESFLSEWCQATGVKNNLTLDKNITNSMYESWKKSKLDDFSTKKLKKKKK